MSPHSYDDDVPYTPGWQDNITGVNAHRLITVARQFAENADKTHGKSMVIIGAAMNHWYHMDMNYRGIINMLMMCGCVGQSGGGWAHYVGQEKLRPQTGWLPLAFALDWHRPPRQMNSTSFFYIHSSQWRHEKLGMNEILSPLANPAEWQGSQIDYNVRSVRMGWLPSAPQLSRQSAGTQSRGHRGRQGAGRLSRRASEGRQARLRARRSRQPGQFPAQPVCLAFQPARILGQGPRVLPQVPAGHESRHCRARTWAKRVARSRWKSTGATRRTASWTCWSRWTSACPPPACTRTSCCPPRPGTRRTTSTLPTCTRSSTRCRAAVDPAWESRNDWDIFKGLAKTFSEVCVGHLGVEKDIVALPTLHDTPSELAQSSTSRTGSEVSAT